MGFGFRDFVKKMTLEKKTTKKEENIHYQQGVLPHGEGPRRGNSREFFPAHFGRVPNFQETSVYEPNFAFFLVISI